MRMSTKMIIVLSVITSVLITLNTFLSVKRDADIAMSRESETMTMLARRIASETDQNIVIMEYGLDEMLQSSDFLSALDTIYRLGEEADYTGEYRRALTQLSNFLYQEPLNDNFYSVNVLNDKGLLLSSHFQKFDMLESYSDELLEQLATIPWLQPESGISLNTKQIIPPHFDPWNVIQDEQHCPVVYTACTQVSYRGRVIGYIEVNSMAEDLNKIFNVSDIQGISTAAIFTNRPAGMLRELYRS